MSNTDSMAMVGLFTLLMVWGLIVSENGQKAVDLHNQENIARMK